VLVSGQDHYREHELQSQLVQLRAALRALPAPPFDETALRETFRAWQRGPAPAIQRRRRVSRRVYLAAALALIAVALGLTRVEFEQSREPALAGVSAVAAPLAAAAVTPEPSAAAFQPLMNSPGFSPSGSYSVVRVRIPLSSFALAQDAQIDGMIEADLLVGEDGLAHGIRFNEADTLRVSAVSR
jgi:hypothetical protein